MPRDGSDVYNVPSGTYGVEDTTIGSAPYNAFVSDVAQDLNHPRPIVAGGTGATNAYDALQALSGEEAKQVITNYNSDPIVPGSFYSASTATGAPVTGHAFSGICYTTDANNMFIEAADQDEVTQPGRKYIRQKKAGVWSAWGINAIIGSAAGDMFFGITGTAPNSQFVVNSKADVSGTNVLTVNKAGVMTGDGVNHSGMVADFAMATAPAGWLPCDGQSLPVGVAGSAYYALWQAIGYTWGGSGANFNVPNLLSRFRRHRYVGGLAGSVGNTQASANQAHTHTGSGSGTTGSENADHSHTFSGTTGTDYPDHTHGYQYGVATNVIQSNNNYPALTSLSGANTTGASARHQHNFSGGTSGINVVHQHAFSYGFTTSGGSGDDPSEARPYSATVLTCIKV